MPPPKASVQPEAIAVLCVKGENGRLYDFWRGLELKFHLKNADKCPVA
jgi:hypothetical protein